MTETREVELRFGSEKIVAEVDVGIMANDDVIVEVARSEVVDERPGLTNFRTGRVIA